MIRRPLFVLLCAPLLLLGTGACQKSETVSGEPTLHLVVDAGSSGTRFCLFKVYADPNRPVVCQATPAAAPFERCQKVKAPDGLADLTPAEVDGTLARGLTKFPTSIREQLNGVIVLGTGGFRRKTAEERRATLDRITNFFKLQGLNAHVEVISGQTEGSLAWHTVRQMKKSTGHAILETGGATVQFAAGRTSDVKSISLPLGMNETFRRLKRNPAFDRCYVVPGNSRAKIDYEQCKALISENIFADSGLQAFVASQGQATTKQTRLYGLGTPWEALFDMAESPRLDHKTIDATAARYCAKSIQELEASGIPAKHAPRNCYLWSYQAALLEATGLSEIQSGGGSWPRGAAASPDYFKDCRAVQ